MLENNKSPGEDKVTTELIRYGEICKQEKLLKGYNEAEIISNLQP